MKIEGKKMVKRILLSAVIIGYFAAMFNSYNQFTIRKEAERQALERAKYEKAVIIIEQKYGKFKTPFEYLGQSIKDSTCFVRRAIAVREEKERQREFLFQYACRFTNEHDAAQYAVTIMNTADEYHEDPFKIAAMVERESEFDKNEVGTHIDTGAMQILPGTARKIAQSMHMKDYHYDMLFDINTNIKMGTKYYKDQVVASRSMKVFRRSKYKPEYIGLILYNRGMGNALNEFKRGEPVTEYADIIMRIYNKIIAEYESTK